MVTYCKNGAFISQQLTRRLKGLKQFARFLQSNAKKASQQF